MKDKLWDILTSEKAVIIWDVDGVLAAYEYGERNHNVCLDSEWDEYLKEYDVYETARPLATLQKWMTEHAVQSACLSAQQPPAWRNLGRKQPSSPGIIRSRSLLSSWQRISLKNLAS